MRKQSNLEAFVKHARGTLKVLDPTSDPFFHEKTNTIHVPGDTDFISEAIAKLDKDGRVLISPGKYNENINIQPGTHIIIQADNPKHSQLYAADPKLPVIHVAPEAQLTLIGASIHGTKSGIVLGSGRPQETARGVTLFNSIVTDAEYGIYGFVKQIHIERCSVEHNVYGLALAGSTSLTDTIIVANLFNALISGGKELSCSLAGYHDSPHQVLVQNVAIMYGLKGGLAICNVASAEIKNVYISKNACFGVQIRNTPDFTISESSVNETFSVNDGCFGDGLFAENSDGSVKNNQFCANKRANIAYFDSGGTIDHNLIIYATFAINLDGASGPVITDNTLIGNKENKVTYSGPICPAPMPELPTL